MKKQLLEIPAAIDPHVHFRTPGAMHKEDWITGARAALAGGITTVCDMPNTKPPTVTRKRLQEKLQLIEEQLPIPLRFHLYLGADTEHLDQIDQTPEAVGLKIFMGSSTGSLLMDRQEDLEEAFAKAPSHLPIAVHAEDETMLQTAAQGAKTVQDHSVVRTPEMAAVAVKRAIELAKVNVKRLYICHVSSRAELDVIRKAKAEGIEVYAEATPHHLFLDTSAYAQLGTRAQMNPPLRSREDREALWEAMRDGTIDTVGTDHAPHLRSEKDRPYPISPSGVPGVETMLPLILTAVAEGKLTLDRAIDLTSRNARKIFNLPEHDDTVLVDMETRRPVDETLLHTKCGWSPFVGWELTGWPQEVRLRGRIYHLQEALV